MRWSTSRASRGAPCRTPSRATGESSRARSPSSCAAPGGGRWSFVPDTEPATVIAGAGADLCLVAARRVAPEDTSLRGTGPDARAVLELVRTYA